MTSPDRQPAGSAYLACDLGAESGRVILGCLSADRRLTVEEIHRFPNAPVRLLGGLRWELPTLFREILVGLARAGARRRGNGAGGLPPLRGVSVDSWGVDYAFYHARQPLLAPAWCYRDGRTDAPFAATLADPKACERIFAETGVQFMHFNTLYQLRADLAHDARLPALADGFLPVADYLNYLLSGVGRVEESVASTTQLYHPGRRAWSTALIEEYGLPPRWFPPVVPSATVLGPLRPDLARDAGLEPEPDANAAAPDATADARPSVQVIATCSHDTAAAVAGVPAANPIEGWAYLISGTWSLLGVERDAPILTPAARAANFSNEVGRGGTIRLLKNLAGLWVLQEARRDWARRGQAFSYSQFTRLARAARPFGALFQPNAARFGRPGGMLGKIADYCRATDQPVPGTPGEFARCIFESLALLYRQTLAELEQLTGERVGVLHVVGGGSRNPLLNQFTADATGRRVLAGPVEATAIGNVLLQALALGELDSPVQLRRVVADSFPVRVVRPRDHERAAWDAAAKRFARLDLLT